jgi:hypothetical protein
LKANCRKSFSRWRNLSKKPDPRGSRYGKRVKKISFAAP